MLNISVQAPAPEEFLDLGGVPRPGTGGETEDRDQPVPVSLHPGDLVQAPPPTEDAQRPRLELEGLRYVVTPVQNVLHDVVKLLSLPALDPDGPCVSEESTSLGLLYHDRHREHGLNTIELSH